jgi:phosphate starvation-inducible PhoH-like protein
LIKKSLEITPGIEPLYGTRDENLRLMEDGLHVTIDLRSDSIVVEGPPAGVEQVERIFADYEGVNARPG